MHNPVLDKFSLLQSSVISSMSEIIFAMSPLSEGGECITDLEVSNLITTIGKTQAILNDLHLSLMQNVEISAYNDTVIAFISNCPLCAVVNPSATVADLVANPLFSQTVFTIKTILEVIDDKIAEQDHSGISRCLTSIAKELDNFPELGEVSNALRLVRDTFTDITAVSDMMFDFEKFYKSVFILHDPLNIGIALGSIKSVLPPPEASEASDVEFF